MKINKKYKKGGANLNYPHGGKHIGEENRVPYPQLDKKKGFYQDGGKHVGEDFIGKAPTKEEMERRTVQSYQDSGIVTPQDTTQFDPGITREDIGNPTRDLIKINPDGGKWLGDKMPPMYGLTDKEDIAFMTQVYEHMDAGNDLNEIFATQSNLRPYIQYIIAGQQGVVLPKIDKGEKEEKGTTMEFVQEKGEELLDWLKENWSSFGGVRALETPDPGIVEEEGEVEEMDEEGEETEEGVTKTLRPGGVQKRGLKPNR